MSTAEKGQGARKARNVGGIATVVAGIAVLAAPLVSRWEGKENTPYKDVVGINTVCYGHTGRDIQKRRYTDAECLSILQADLQKHIAPIVACVPQLAENRNAATAAASLSFNIGSAGFCRSSAAKAFRARDWAAGCKAMTRYVYAGGRVVKGLKNRRAAEYAICMKPAGPVVPDAA